MATVLLVLAVGCVFLWQLWYVFFRRGSRPPAYLTALRDRLGGEITIERENLFLQAVLRTQFDGADVTIRSMTVRIDHERSDPAIQIETTEASALSLVAVNPGPRPAWAFEVVDMLGVETRGTRPLALRGPLERFDWATDRPEVATPLLGDEETLRAWVRLLSHPAARATAVSLVAPGAICAVIDGGLDADGIEALLIGLHLVIRAANAVHPW